MSESNRKPDAVSRRDVVLAGSAGIIGVPAILRRRYRVSSGSQRTYSARALDLYSQNTAIDMLGPWILDSQKGNEWLTNPDAFNESDWRRYRDSGIDVFHVATGMGGVNAYQTVLTFFAAWNGFIANHDRRLMRIDSAEDLDRVRESGKVGIMLGLQNSEHFRTPRDVRTFHGLGQRVSQLTYNARNRIGNGSTERVDGGISDFGVSIIEAMNEEGMAVDVSHCGDRTTLDAFEISTRPVLITHSNCRALAPGHPRCKTDEAIRSMARSGGVMGITGVRMFVKNDEPTTIEHMLDHFDHVARLVGVEHLGIGSDIDLDGYDDMPPEQNARLRAGYKGSYGFREKIDIEGADHPLRMLDITEGLFRRGYSDADVAGVLGGNFARVLKEIW